MTKLRITNLPDDKPVKISVELPAAVHRDLLAYSELVSRQSGQPANDLGKLVTAMVTHFMATDRAFAKLRKSRE
ncbi:MULTISPECIES: DUF2274 domain-containing protein [Bradyrhizobium]|jgi:hypothetical protein|uniref:DUF2274 domain-containing protein n=1 Tax=Bradyrhizobium denitrificans TaxID=2734912 RepID=A0ABS5GAQ4_9BRAD|nr:MULTISPECIES: DUF2274 domain-containing protein [Bradyrhizobium]MBR1138114.1 DUF2274 domain-containing protein [Bradyrhizobium denitrificans]MDU0961115.1 DUF2274 domain-containing protein [Bradyrhizobium sp.]MDU1497454.1 DUF2274 domain-containing protein [Bradyrhizobium sp.]MDU1547660.1 DUF2274 domain-containing protein [Bradyrhizobium sp.]MDU1692656.1 DUF2274 domain-containing protein [Bradyrhizobium sp.]